MTRRAMSLMDVLVPPGNDWLKELARRKTDLPAGVHIVRFSDNDDETAVDDCLRIPLPAKAGTRNPAAVLREPCRRRPARCNSAA